MANKFTNFELEDCDAVDFFRSIDMSANGLILAGSSMGTLIEGATGHETTLS